MANSIINFDKCPEELDKIESLMKKWNMKTRTKVLLKCLNKVYAQESV